MSDFKVSKVNKKNVIEITNVTTTNIDSPTIDREIERTKMMIGDIQKRLDEFNTKLADLVDMQSALGAKEKETSEDAQADIKNG